MNNQKMIMKVVYKNLLKSDLIYLSKLCKNSKLIEMEN